MVREERLAQGFVVLGDPGRRLRSSEWPVDSSAQGENFGATLVTRDSDAGGRNVLGSVEGLAKHDCKKKVFVNVRSPLMGGGSGWCQLLFVQHGKQWCPPLPCAPVQPCECCCGKAATQGWGEERWGCWCSLETQHLLPFPVLFQDDSLWSWGGLDVACLMLTRVCSKLPAGMVVPLL